MLALFEKVFWRYYLEQRSDSPRRSRSTRRI